MAKPKAGKPHTHTRTHSRVTELRGHTHTTHTCPTLEDRRSRVDQPTGVGAVGCADICIDTVKFARSCCENRLFFREVIEFCLTSCCMSCFIISTLFLCCHKGVYCLALGRLERPRGHTRAPHAARRMHASRESLRSVCSLGRSRRPRARQ